MSILKVRKRSEVIAPLSPIDGDPFTLQVRHLGEEQQQELNRLTSVDKVVKGAVVTETDGDKYLQHAPDFYIAGWEKLSIATFARLGIELEEPPETNGDGCVHYSKEMARELWRNAQARKFAIPIIGTSTEALGIVQAIAEAEKKRSPAT